MYIGATYETAIDGGVFAYAGDIETPEEEVAVVARVKMGSHAILGGQHVCVYRIVKDGKVLLV